MKEIVKTKAEFDKIVNKKQYEESMKVGIGSSKKKNKINKKLTKLAKRKRKQT